MTLKRAAVALLLLGVCVVGIALSTLLGRE